MISLELAALPIQELIDLSINHLSLTAEMIEEKCRIYCNREPYKVFLNCESKPYKFLTSEKDLIEALIHEKVLKEDHYLIFYDRGLMSEVCYTEMVRESEKLGLYDFET